MGGMHDSVSRRPGAPSDLPEVPWECTTRPHDRGAAPGPGPGAQPRTGPGICPARDGPGPGAQDRERREEGGHPGPGTAQPRGPPGPQWCVPLRLEGDVEKRAVGDGDAGRPHPPGGFAK